MRLIDADALMEREGISHFAVFARGSGKTLFRACRTYLQCVVDDAPTIDQEELRPKGRWMMKDNRGNGVCSHCNRQDRIDPLATHCRYCGAKMEVK